MTSDIPIELPRLAAPAPSSLVESLRGVGYSLPDAIADIIDNSISADATIVWLRFEWNGGNSYISILDDGRGMASDEIVEAMRLGTHGPDVTRAASDLGRFGLGLKTASFSQCRRLTVASRAEQNRVAAWRWDLDYLSKAPDWFLLPGTHAGSESHLQLTESLAHGTLILWEVLDRIVGQASVSDRRAHDSFLTQIDAVEDHLAMTFHRYLEGNSPLLRVFINGSSESCRVKPWDPFLKNHPATTSTPVERIPTSGGWVELQGHVLPHRDRLEDEEYRSAGGLHGWLAHQGFYLYRNKRLLVGGSWLGLGETRAWPKEDVYRLARIRLEIPNTADHEWKIDIKKSRASPPPMLIDRLRGLATTVRERARQVVISRASPRQRSESATLFAAWLVREGAPGKVRYSINREHPAISHLLSTTGERSAAIEAMLRIVEQSVPIQRIWLDVTTDDETKRRDSDVDVEAVRLVMQAIFDDLVRVGGLFEDQAKLLLSTMEPFQRHPDMILELSIAPT